MSATIMAICMSVKWCIVTPVSYSGPMELCVGRCFVWGLPRTPESATTTSLTTLTVGRDSQSQVSVPSMCESLSADVYIARYRIAANSYASAAML